ncbi:MAG: hypothetical protein M3R24_12890 [Chloroflexota bacterium]|nr:hypothetical protein [Chloroflexota bacterium]
MSQLLEEAMTRVQQLPTPEQDAIAQLILDELTDNERWDAAFARSQDALTRLAAKVRGDIRTGKTTSMGMDEV